MTQIQKQNKQKYWSTIIIIVFISPNLIMQAGNELKKDTNLQ